MSTETVGADVALLSDLDPAAREVAVTGMLDQARQWLERAKESTTPAQDVAQFKAFVATVAEAAKQKKLSEDIQLDAVEMVRRSERALGVAIRQGQEAGDIRVTGQGGGDPRFVDPGRDTNRMSPTSLFAHKTEMVQTYAVTDGVTDDQFDAALAEAKEEGNLSRANVVRKVQELAPVRLEPRRVSRRKDVEIIESLLASLDGLRLTLDTIHILDNSITPEDAERFDKGLGRGIKSIARIQKLIKEKK